MLTAGVAYDWTEYRNFSSPSGDDYLILVTDTEGGVIRFGGAGRSEDEAYAVLARLIQSGDCFGGMVTKYLGAAYRRVERR